MSLGACQSGLRSVVRVAFCRSATSRSYVHSSPVLALPIYRGLVTKQYWSSLLVATLCVFHGTCNALNVSQSFRSKACSGLGFRVVRIAALLDNAFVILFETSETIAAGTTDLMCEILSILISSKLDSLWIFHPRLVR